MRQIRTSGLMSGEGKRSDWQTPQVTAPFLDSTSLRAGRNVDQTHIVDRDLNVVHGPRFCLSLWDGFALARLSLTPEPWLDGRRVEEFFSPKSFETEFWLLWSTNMGSLPQHSLIEFRRYMNRFVYLFPDLSTMAHVLRSPFNQHETFIKPLVAWLRLLEASGPPAPVSSPAAAPEDSQALEHSAQRTLQQRFDLAARAMAIDRFP
jgi:hypothetical protein